MVKHCITVTNTLRFQVSLGIGAPDIGTIGTTVALKKIDISNWMNPKNSLQYSDKRLSLPAKTKEKLFIMYQSARTKYFCIN